MFDLQDIFGTRANGKSDTMSVLRSPLEGAEDEHIKGTLKQLNAVAIGFASRHRLSSSQSTTLCGRLSTTFLVPNLANEGLPKLGIQTSRFVCPDYLFVASHNCSFQSGCDPASDCGRLTGITGQSLPVFALGFKWYSATRR